MSREIYLVHAETLHDGSDPVRGFPEKAQADAFAQECRDYDATFEPPPAATSPCGSWDEWHERHKAWERTHPADPYPRREYVVRPLPFGAITK